MIEKINNGEVVPYVTKTEQTMNESRNNDLGAVVNEVLESITIPLIYVIRF